MVVPLRMALQRIYCRPWPPPPANGHNREYCQDCGGVGSPDRGFHPLYKRVQVIQCTHTLYACTALVHCTHTLYSYTVLIHCTHTLYSYTVLIHCTHTLIHHTLYSYTHTPYTVLIRSYTIHYTPYTIHHTPYTHTPYTHTPYTVLIHSYNIYTTHHTPYTLSTCTATPRPSGSSSTALPFLAAPSLYRSPLAYAPPRSLKALPTRLVHSQRRHTMRMGRRCSRPTPRHRGGCLLRSLLQWTCLL
jgi:hypothetical protein